MRHRGPWVWVVVLALGAASAGAARADQNEIEKGLLQEIARAKLVPFEKSKLKGFYPRTSIVGGALEKIANKVYETDGKSLGFMLTESAQPSGVTGNPYVDATKGRTGNGASLESALAKTIMTAKKPLTPGQLLGNALALTKGDYWLATLVCHNLLKEVTYAERDGRQALLGWDAKDPSKAKKWVVLDPKSVTAKLPNLRPANDPLVGDKMGPWYHMYGLFFVGGMLSGSEAESMAWVENLTRKLGLGSNGDPFKEGMNVWASELTHAMNDLVGKNLQVPGPDDAASMSKADLTAKIEALKAEHKKLQAQLVGLAPMVNDDRHGAAAETRMTAIRRQQKTIYDEVQRLQAELAKRP